MSSITSYIEKCVMILEPQGVLERYVRSTGDIVTCKSFLKQLPCSDYAVTHISRILCQAIESKRRFRRLECLKVIRAIVKDRHEPELDQETVSLLFKLYQHFIFDPNEQIQWCVSAILRGRRLRTEELRWILERWDQSQHLVNRLLRYPAADQLLSEWAIEVLRGRKLKDRRAEVIALLVEDPLPAPVRREPEEVKLWGVYYCRLSREAKIRLLMGMYPKRAIDSFVDICLRLGAAEPLRGLLQKYETI